MLSGAQGKCLYRREEQVKNINWSIKSSICSDDTGALSDFDDL